MICKHCKKELNNTLMQILLHEDDCEDNPKNKPQEIDSYTVEITPEMRRNFNEAMRYVDFGQMVGKKPPQKISKHMKTEKELVSKMGAIEYLKYLSSIVSKEEDPSTEDVIDWE
jgi:hypothetical protein